MNKLIFFRSLALLNFLGLVTLFVVYKNGSLGNLDFHQAGDYFLSPNGGVGATSSPDTTNVKLDSILYNRFIFSKPPADLDNLFPKGITMNQHPDSVIVNGQSIKVKELTYMSSSKAGPIIKSRPLKTSQEKNNKKRK